MEELRRLRKAKGLSQAQLAVKAGLDPSTVSQIETGARRANMRTLERLATVLGSEVAELFPLGQASLPALRGERSPEEEQRRNFYDRIRDLGTEALEELRDEEHAQYARLDSEWREAAAEDPTSARTAMLASQVNMAHGFAFQASLELYVRENPTARFTPIQPETRMQVEREVARKHEALVGAASG